MKTVGEFKKAGLVFVEGDTVVNEGVTVSEVMRKSHAEAVNFKLSNITALNFDVKEFAWRENTGVKPEFSGDKELELKNGEIKLTSTFVAEDNEDWSILGEDNDIAKWRPSMNRVQQWPDNSRMDIIGQNGNDGLHYDNTAQQVEIIVNNNTPFSIELAEKGGLKAASSDKPVFTQAMADAYKMPAIGSWFTLHYHEHGSRFNDMDGQDFEVIGINDDVYTFRNDIKGYGALKLNAINCTPIDTRTDREKAIDEMFDDAKVQGSKGAFERLYDAGYRKC